MKFKKKPVIIEAEQFTEENKDHAYHWATEKYQAVYPTRDKDDNPILKIQTLEGEMTCSIGDWIILGVKGEIYPCKPDIFELTYEKVD